MSDTFGFILLLVCYFLSSVFKLGANIVIPVYAGQFRFSSTVNGLLSSSYFLSYAVMQLLSGPLCKKYSSTRVVGYSMLISLLGCLGFAFASSPFWVFSARLCTGFGMGTIFVGLIEFETEHYSGRSYERAVSIAFASTSIGSICSAAPLNYLIVNAGIKSAFILFAFIILLLSVLLLSYSKNIEVRQMESGSVSLQVRHAVRVINSSGILICATGIWLTYIALQMSYSGMWCTSWALKSFADKASLAPINGSAFGIALMFGSLLSSFVHRMGTTCAKASRNAGWLIAVSFFSVILFHHLGLFWASFPFILLFGFMSGHICVQLIAMCREKTSSDDNATVTGFWNALASLSVLFAQWSSGVLIGRFDYTPAVLVYLFIHLVMTLIFSICIRHNKHKV